MAPGALTVRAAAKDGIAEAVCWGEATVMCELARVVGWGGRD